MSSGIHSLQITVADSFLADQVPLSSDSHYELFVTWCEQNKSMTWVSKDSPVSEDSHEITTGVPWILLGSQRFGLFFIIGCHSSPRDSQKPSLQEDSTGQKRSDVCDVRTVPQHASAVHHQFLRLLAHIRHNLNRAHMKRTFVNYRISPGLLLSSAFLQG